MKKIIKEIEVGRRFNYLGETYVVNQKGICDAHCIDVNTPDNAIRDYGLTLHNLTEVDVLFQFGDFVRLGADIPYQVTTENGLQNVNSKPYRFATDKETEIAKMYQAYKRKKGVKLQDVYDTLKAIDNA